MSFLDVFVSAAIRRETTPAARGGGCKLLVLVESDSILLVLRADKMRRGCPNGGAVKA